MSTCLFRGPSPQPQGCLASTYPLNLSEGNGAIECSPWGEGPHPSPCSPSQFSDGGVSRTKSQKKTLYPSPLGLFFLKFLLTDFRRGERQTAGRQTQHRPTVPPIRALTDRLSYVPQLGVQPATLAHQDDVATELPSQSLLGAFRLAGDIPFPPLLYFAFYFYLFTVIVQVQLSPFSHHHFPLHHPPPPSTLNPAPLCLCPRVLYVYFAILLSNVF